MLIIFDSAFIALAFPLIEDEFASSSRTTLSWVSSCYFISLATLMLVAGRVADRVGRRVVFLAGLTMYAFGALLMGFAGSVPVLLGARTLQGAGAAALTPVSLAIVLPEFPASRRSTAIGGWAVLGGSAGVLAPTLGALIVNWGGWRAPFVVLVGLLAGVGIAALYILDADPPAALTAPIDLMSVPLAVLAIGGFALALTEAGDWGLSDARMITTLGISSAALPALLWRSARKEGGLIDLRLFNVRSYAFGSAASVFTQIGFFAFFFATPLFFTEAWGYSVVAAGLALALNQGVSAVVGLPLGHLADKIGVATIVAVGGALSTVSFVWLAISVGEEPNFGLAIVPAFVIGGIGGMANGAFTTSLALRDIDDDALTRASSGYYVTRRLASGMGVVLASVILGDASGVDSLERFRILWFFVAVCYALSGACALAPNRPANVPNRAA